MKAVMPGHHHIEQDQIWPGTRGDLDRILAAAHRKDFIALRLEHIAEQAEARGGVVNDEDAALAHVTGICAMIR